VRRPGTVEPALTALSTDELLARAPGDPDARDEVVRRFTPLAMAQVRRYRGKGTSEADLEQVALLGMLRALDRYDPEIGAFDPYASRTISGELKRYFRDRAWSVRVPRALQERVLDVTRVGQELSQRLGRVPAPAEIAVELDITVEEVLEAIGASVAYASISLEAPDEDTGWTVADALGVEDLELALADGRRMLEPAMAALPERERHILYLRFFEDMTQSEIAEVVGVSQMHVSRLLARALDRLRATVE
jgi:RNA polymerase sigma-B factor